MVPAPGSTARNDLTVLGSLYGGYHYFESKLSAPDFRKLPLGHGERERERESERRSSVCLAVQTKDENVESPVSSYRYAGRAKQQMCGTNPGHPLARRPRNLRLLGVKDLKLQGFDAYYYFIMF